MKKNKYIIIAALVLLFISNNKILSQNTATSYFMSEVSERYNINPAIAPECNYYFDFIVLPNFYVGASTDNLVVKDFIFNKNGATTSIFNSRESLDKFYNHIKPTTTIGADLSVNLISFGFRIKKHYFMIDAGIKATASTYLPKDLFNFALKGTPDENGINSYNLKSFGLDMSMYSNVNLGYTYTHDKFSFGARAKFLIGYANITSNIKEMQLNASRKEWELTSDAHINASLPITYQSNSKGGIDLNTIGLAPTNELIALLYKPAGYGAAFDFGATYKPIRNLTISAAVTDLGFIRWRKNIISGTINGNHSLKDLIEYNVGDSIDPSIIATNIQNLGNEVLETIKTDCEKKNYNSMIKGNFLVAAEYGIVNNKISFGIINQLRFNRSRLQDEITLAANFRPAPWFHASLSYSFINGRWGNLGLGLNLNVGALSMFIIADYIPLTWANLNRNGISTPLPYKTQCANIQGGFSFNIGRDARRKARERMNEVQHWGYDVE